MQIKLQKEVQKNQIKCETSMKEMARMEMEMKMTRAGGIAMKGMKEMEEMEEMEREWKLQ